MVHRWLFALVVCSLIQPAYAAEQTDTLAQRLKALKKGWSFASDQQAEAAQADRELAAAGDDAGALPRVDPREVLPRRWFGEGVASPSSAARASAAVGEGQDTGGSARARLLRDLRAGSGGTPRVAGRSLLAPTGGRRSSNNSGDTDAKPAASSRGVARAGSVLSGTATGPADAAATTAEGPRNNSATAALAKAIAQDVADSMADADVADELLDLKDADSSADQVATKEDTDSASDNRYEPIRLAARPQQFASAAADSKPPAKSDATSDRLPLFIGEGYAKSSAATRVTKRPTARVAVEAASPLPSATRQETSDQWLLTQAAPMLVSRVQGPRSIVVGREATYKVVLANRGDADAHDLVTRVTIPAGVEVVGASARQGRVSRSDDGDAGVVVWEMDELTTQNPEGLELRLIARTGQPIELGVAWEHRPVDAATVVEVQEPKLDMELAGPNEVLYGKPQVYRLTLSNPGTGVAEDVVLRLTPPGQQNRTTTHSIGSLDPGASRSVEIELVAREAGNLLILADATAAGDVRADTKREIVCRKPELVVDWRGPEERYAGAPALYYFRVRNPGTATAPGVALTVDLPEGFRVINAGDGRTAVGSQLTYRVGSLRAGEDRYFELRGVFDRAGDNELVLEAVGSDETRSENVVARTEVVAIADLKLDVSDPKGPIATGQEVAYTIRVTNRGANEARAVRVVGLFSAGIEPVSVEGGTSQIEDGRVTFEAIDSLAAGAEQVFTIRARAEEAGTHLFRAEVLCRDLEIKLAAEETTRFFRDDMIDVAADGGGYYPR